MAANVFLGSSLALCTGASYASSRLLPFAHGVLGCGALSLVGYAQTFFFTGRLAAQWLPQNYRQVADTFGWTVGEIRCAAGGGAWVAGWPVAPETVCWRVGAFCWPGRPLLVVVLLV